MSRRLSRKANFYFFFGRRTKKPFASLKPNWLPNNVQFDSQLQPARPLERTRTWDPPMEKIGGGMAAPWKSVWTEEYCQTRQNKNKSPNFWRVTSILVGCMVNYNKQDCWSVQGHGNWSPPMENIGGGMTAPSKSSPPLTKCHVGCQEKPILNFFWTPNKKAFRVKNRAD